MPSTVDTALAHALKHTIITHYNPMGVCEHCGYGDMRVLDMQRAHDTPRPALSRGTPLYRWLVDNQYPHGYLVLCKNCQYLYDHPQRAGERP